MSRTKIELLSNPELETMQGKERFFSNQLRLRTARKEGDQETVNNYVLGQFNYMGVKYKKLDN